VDSGNRKTQAEFICFACGYADNADHVGDMNVLVAGQAVVAARGGLSAQGSPMKREPPKRLGRVRAPAQ
jgi:putative transposase